ncbi:hypothetical protein [Rhizobium sp. Root482]|uniref:hypothetical protein n=1 Tax=Rhizobium sp. Root482 TaxID=1736543 RepID=UPI0006FC76C1|nr:hypothetical protein [Rhizobium sp. Root482]KQY22539.1 hypothetical protein ASD31_22870 [Rhizobium sp. Root482]
MNLDLVTIRGGTPLGNYYHPDKDALRQEINRWIRESGAIDAIVDFDACCAIPTTRRGSTRRSTLATTFIPVTRAIERWPTPSISMR